MNSGKFHLPGKKLLYQQICSWSVLIVDVTESPIERPKKTNEATTVRQKRGEYSSRFCLGKKRRHTLEAQVLVNQANGHIICTAFGKGRVHDFRLFKLHRVPMLSRRI